MILWSIVPPDIIFSDVNIEPIYEEVEYSGLKCVVEKINSAQCRIVRLLTTNPSDYLRNELQPGTILTYERMFKGLS